MKIKDVLAAFRAVHHHFFLAPPEFNPHGFAIGAMEGVAVRETVFEITLHMSAHI